jgi:hypothetical protein
MSDNDDCRAYVPQARLRAQSLYRPPSGSPKMSHIDVAKRVLRRVHGVADAHQGRLHRAAAFPAWRIARDCGGFDISGPCEIENATARRYPSRRLAGAASRVPDRPWAGSRFRAPGRVLAVASAREGPLGTSAARWRRRRAFIRAACTGEQADKWKNSSGIGR